MLTIEEALLRLLDTVHPVQEVEKVPLVSACGRVLAETQYAEMDVPGEDNSAMDGYAFRFSDIQGNSTVLTIRQRIAAGQRGIRVGVGEAAQIFTGAPIPEGADTVIRQEWCSVNGEKLQFLQLPKKGESIRRAGEDIRKGQAILSKSIRLQPQHIGIAASVGITHLPVLKKPKVALMSTGDELISPGEPLAPSKIYNSNRYMLLALLKKCGCEVTDYGIIPDDFKATYEALDKAASGHDLILTSGGVSVGEEDHVKAAIEAQGTLSFWKIAIKPGKPLVYGHISGSNKAKERTAIMGVPGNPVSAFVTFLLFVRPYLLRMQGIKEVMPKSVQVKAANAYSKTDGRNEFLRAKINERGEAEIFKNQGSGVLSSVAWSDGLINNPPGNAIKAGDWVTFIAFSEFFS